MRMLMDTKKPRDFEIPEEDRAFYDYYMRLPGTGRGFSLSSWVVEINTNNIEQQLPAHARKDPLLVLRSKPPSIDSIRLCLELYIARTQQQCNSPIMRRQKYAQDKPASAGLFCILNNNFHETVDLRSHQRLLRAMAHCIAGEDNIEVFWRWAYSDHSPAFAATWTRVEANQWKTWLLRYLIEAIVSFSLTKSNIDGLIEMYLGVLYRNIELMQRSETPATGAWGAHIAPCGRWIINYIKSLPNPTTQKPKKFDRFKSSLGFWLDDPVDLHFLRSRLNVKHPLDRQSRKREALWVLQYGRSILPEWFAMRPNKRATETEEEPQVQVPGQRKVSSELWKLRLEERRRGSPTGREAEPQALNSRRD